MLLFSIKSEQKWSIISNNTGFIFKFSALVSKIQRTNNILSAIFSFILITLQGQNVPLIGQEKYW